MRAPGRRARGTVAPALVLTLPPASGVQSFYGEHIFTGYPTNVEVEHVAGKLSILIFRLGNQFDFSSQVRP